MRFWKRVKKESAGLAEARLARENAEARLAKVLAQQQEAGLFPVTWDNVHWMFADGDTTPIQDMDDRDWHEALALTGPPWRQE
jgi:hypothetical protein